MKYLVKATFIGEDGLLGYKKNRTYLLEVQELGAFTRLLDGYSLTIRRWKDLLGECPYETMQSFLQNWRVQDVG